MKLTEMEQSLMVGMCRNEYCDAREGGSPWAWACYDHAGLDHKQARGVVASLVQKKLVSVYDYEGKGRADDMVLDFTEEGKRVAAEVCEEPTAFELNPNDDPPM